MSALPSQDPAWRVGARTIDDDGEIGVIIEIEDDHNIWVEIQTPFGKGGAVYCCVPGCEDYYPCRLIKNP